MALRVDGVTAAWLLASAACLGCGPNPSPRPEPAVAPAPTAEAEPPPEPEAPSACEAEAAHALADLRPLAESALGDCDPATARCRRFDEALVDDDDESDRCRIDVARFDGHSLVRVWPAPTPGAPRTLTVGVLPGPRTGRAPSVSGSRWAVGETARIVGHTGRISHSHGGPAASVAFVRFDVDVDGSETLSASALRWMASRDCSVPTDVIARPRVLGVSIDDAPAPSVRIDAPATVNVSFEPVGASYSHCDRYVAEVDFVVGGAPLTSAVEIEVSRRDER